jgi:hypothetical protein
MRIQRLLILPLLVSVCVAQSLPGNFKKDRKSYLCIEMEPLAAPPEWMKSLFPRPVLFQPLASFRQHDGSILTHIIPPPEFRAHNLTRVDASGVSLFRTPHGPSLCYGIRSDAQGRFHGIVYP